MTAKRRPGFFELTIVPREDLDVTLTVNQDLPSSGSFKADVRQHQDDGSPEFSLTVTKTGTRTLRLQATSAQTLQLLTNDVYRGYLDVWHSDTEKTFLLWTVFDLQPSATSAF